MRRTSLTVWLLAAGCLSCPAHTTPAQDGPRPGQSDPSPGAHDPSTIVKHKCEYWTFTTGRGVSSLRSKDLVHWERGPAVFPEPPKWITDVVPQQKGHFWAPDVIHHDGRYLLYYSVSALGKRTSAIALASNPTLDPGDPEYRWTDHGIVIRTDERSDYNAIDPSVVRGHGGTLWLAFGSFWSGIKLIQLDPKTGKRIAPDSPVLALAHKEQIEAAALYQHGDDFYLFVNWGLCCRGVRSTYNIRVGRSRTITGPYLDKDGIDLLKGGGSLLLGTEGRFIGPGHAGILKDGDRYWLSYHFYDGAENGRPRLAIRPLEWAADGWPRVAGKPITPPDPR
jgi:arabinan endo-1,5-alpha-L-arabinosidase